MPTPRQAMFAALTGEPTITAIVGNRIYPDQAKEGSVDYLDFQVVSDVKPTTLRGTMGIRFVRFQLTAEMTRRADAEALQFAIEALLHGKANATLGGLTVKSSMVVVDEGAVDEDELPRPGEESGNRVLRIDVMWAV